MKKWLKIGEASIELGVCTKTIRRWDKAGSIKCSRTIGNHRRIHIFEIHRIRDGKSYSVDRTVAIYCRVSSHDQKKKGDLGRQIEKIKEYCHINNIDVQHVFTDVASGLNTKRNGFLRLCKLIEKGEINRVFVSYPDRLTRFGFKYIARYFLSHGTTIHVLNTSETKSMQQELVDDLIAIVTSFSGRVHGLRSRKKRKK
jgi:predicted site-specific integrase-resolvase